MKSTAPGGPASLRPKRWAPIPLLLLASCLSPIEEAPLVQAQKSACSSASVARDSSCPTLSAEEVLQKLSTCGGSNCHGGAGAQLGVNLEFGSYATGITELAGRFRNVPSRLPGCHDRLLIDTENPECSFLFEKFSASPQCGDPMPLGSTGMSEAEFRCLRQAFADVFRGR